MLHFVASQQWDRAAVHLRVEIRAQRPSLGVVTVRIVPRAHEHFLHHFFREHPVAENAASEREARAPVPLVHLRERALVASGDRGTERRVVCITKVTLGEA